MSDPTACDSVSTFISFKIFAHGTYINAHSARPMVLVFDFCIVCRAGDLIHSIDFIRAGICKTFAGTGFQAFTTVKAEIAFKHGVAVYGRIGNN